MGIDVTSVHVATGSVFPRSFTESHSKTLLAIGVPHGKHVTGGHAQGGKTCLYTYLGGAKVIYSYINL